MSLVNIEKFWAKVNIRAPDECWEWLAFKLSSGYGRFRVGDKIELAHRVAWSIINGSIPEGKLILHKCDNRSCCNPNHLYCGNYSDNISDRSLRYTGYIGGGCRSNMFSKGEIDFIKTSVGQGCTQQSIANLYGVSQSYISRIIADECGTNAI